MNNFEKIWAGFVVFFLSLIIGFFVSEFFLNLEIKDLLAQSPEESFQINIEAPKKTQMLERCKEEISSAFCNEIAKQKGEDATDCGFSLEILKKIEETKEQEEEINKYKVPEGVSEPELSYHEAMEKIFESNLQASEMIPYTMKTLRHLRRNLLEICGNREKTPSCSLSEESNQDSEAISSVEYCRNAVDKYMEIAFLDAKNLLESEIEEKDIDFLTEKFVVLHKNIKELNEYVYLYLAKFSDFNKKFGCFIKMCQL